MRLLFICSQHLWLREVFCSDIWYKVRSERVRVGLMAGRGWGRDLELPLPPVPLRSNNDITNTALPLSHAPTVCSQCLSPPWSSLIFLLIFQFQLLLLKPSYLPPLPPAPKHIFLQDSYTFPITADWGLVYTWAFLIFTIRYDTLLMCNILSYTASLQIFHDIKVTVDLQGCLPKNHSYAHCLYYNHRKVYIIVKLIKCRIRRNNSLI